MATSQFAYTSEACAALIQNPEDRSEAIRGLAEARLNERCGAATVYCAGEKPGAVAPEI